MSSEGDYSFWRFSLQSFKFGLQLLFGFSPCRIEGNATDWTHLLALGFAMVTDTFGASMRVDLINFRPHENRIVGTLGFAHIAIDAIVGNHQCHGVDTYLFHFRLKSEIVVCLVGMLQRCFSLVWPATRRSSRFAPSPAKRTTISLFKWKWN